MTDGRSWEGNWKVRLYERVRERGYDSLTAFAEARPTADPHEDPADPGGGASKPVGGMETCPWEVRVQEALSRVAGRAACARFRHSPSRAANSSTCGLRSRE